jgi:hypothetical protein
MDDFTKENPAMNGANLNAIYAFKGTPKTKKAQRKNGFIVEVTIRPDNPEDSPIVFNLDGKPACSLWYLYQCQAGLTRAEALDRHFILSLTQHVRYFRKDLGLDILTERIPPTRYANYHLITPVSIRILSQGGQ